MNIIQSQKIGLCVAGTKSRQGGFTPLVIAGILAGGEVNGMDRTTLVVEKPVYVIKHTSEYILYLLIDSKVKPCDRDTFGVLSIALTIARDMRLADGKSPYALLKDVYDKFRSDYMVPDGTDCDRFINKEVNPADFASIMEQYPVENHSWDKYVEMDPSGLSGTLCVPQDKMEDLFRDSQYTEFAAFKEIEIGTYCQTTIGLENIEIPRPVVYSIELNGKPIKSTTVSRPEDKFDTASVLHNTTDVEYENMSFSLGDLLEAPEHRIESESGNSSVVLDTKRKLIVCTIEKTPITYSLSYEIHEGTEEQQKQLVDWISNGKVQLAFGGTPVGFPPATSPLNPKQTYIRASLAHKSVSYRANDLDLTFKLSVQATVDDNEKHVQVTITIIPKAVDSFLTYSLGYGILGGTKKEQKQLASWISNGSVKLTFGGESAEFFSDSKQASIPASWVQKEVGYQTYQELTAFDLSLKSIVDDEKKHVLVIITITPKAVDYSLEYKVIGGTKKQQRQLVDWISNGTVLLTFGGKSADFLSNPKQVSIPASCVHQEASYRIYQDFTTFDLSLKSIVDDEKKHVKVIITITSKKKDKAKKIVILLSVCCFVGMCIGAGIVGGVWYFWGAKKLTYEDSVQIVKEILPKKPTIITEEMLTPHTLLRRHIDDLLLEDGIIDTTSVDTGGEREDTVTSPKQRMNPNDVEDNSEKEKALAEILSLINKKNLQGCRNHEGWEKYLKWKQRVQIEAVLLNFREYKDLSTNAKERVKKLNNGNFKTLEDVYEAKKQIDKIIDEERKNGRLNKSGN